MKRLAISYHMLLGLMQAAVPALATWGFIEGDLRAPLAIAAVMATAGSTASFISAVMWWAA